MNGLLETIWGFMAFCFGLAVAGTVLLSWAAILKFLINYVFM